MGEMATFVVSENPFPASFVDNEESEHHFFNTIGENNGMEQPGMITSRIETPYAQLNIGSNGQTHDVCGRVQTQDGPRGEEETYFPSQGYQRASTDVQKNEHSMVHSTEQHREETLNHEVVPPPPPTAFFDQVTAEGFSRRATDAGTWPEESLSETIAPRSQQYGYGAGTAAMVFHPKDPAGPHGDVCVGTEQPPSASADTEYKKSVTNHDNDSSDDETREPRIGYHDGTARTKAKVNPNLQAGRRKLEEFKRKKAAALSRKNSLSQQREYVRQEFAETKLEEAQEEIQRLRSEVQQLSTDVEAYAEEKTVMEREKAALLGELVSIKASVEANPAASSDAIDLLREEIGAMRERTESLESSLIASRSECTLLVEEKSKLEEALHALRIQTAVPIEQHATVSSDALLAEIQSLQDSLKSASEREAQLQDDVFESRENIDSLRELLSEGEQERLELVETIQKLNEELHAMRSEAGNPYQAQPVVHDDAMYCQKIAELEANLSRAQQEIQEWRRKAENKSEAQLDHGAFDAAGGTDASLQALRVKLAKAEAAVEAERQAYQALDQKSKQWQDSVQENMAMRSQMIELREREKSLEQQIESLHLGRGDMVASPNEVQQAVQRAQAAERQAHELHVELEQANITITKLSGEVNDLITRLKEQSQVIVEMKEKETPFDSVPINDGASPPRQSTTAITDMSHQSMAQPPPQSMSHNQTSLFDLYQQPPPMTQEPMHAVVEETFRADQQQTSPTMQPIPWTVPGGIIEPEQSPEMEQSQHPTEEEDSAPRKVGFWSWVAGADLASR